MDAFTLENNRAVFEMYAKKLRFVLAFSLVVSSVLLAGCGRAIHDGLSDFITGEIDSEGVTEYIDSHPYAATANDGYCTVVYGGPNPYGASNFRVHNSSDEKRLVTIRIVIKNGEYTYDNGDYLKTNRSGYTEYNGCSCVVEPGETRDMKATWSEHPKKGTQVDYSSHTVSITEMTSEATSRSY